jgi:hypothetical protein
MNTYLTLDKERGWL